MMCVIFLLQKLFLLISAVLAAANADVSHLAIDNSLDGYYYQQQPYAPDNEGYVYSVPSVDDYPDQSQNVIDQGYVYEPPRIPFVYPEKKVSHIHHPPY